MSGDPQRQYARLLEPTARGQKLLRRLRHHRLMDSADWRLAESRLKVLQKLLAKDVPAMVFGFSGLDLLAFPQGKYLGLSLSPEAASGLVAMTRERVLDGALLLGKGRSSALWVSEGLLALDIGLLDRLGVPLLASLTGVWEPGEFCGWPERLDPDLATEILAMVGAGAHVGLGQSPRPTPESWLAMARLYRGRGRAEKVRALPGREETLNYLAENLPQIKVWEEGGERWAAYRPVSG